MLTLRHKVFLIISLLRSKFPANSGLPELNQKAIYRFRFFVMNPVSRAVQHYQSSAITLVGAHLRQRRMESKILFAPEDEWRYPVKQTADHFRQVGELEKQHIAAAKTLIPVHMERPAKRSMMRRV